ncbi:MAG: HNH endonuclease [Lachnospiraceae bacterium]|nr:HNH endonuclease [Lachnospiraceae bacterium]
MILNWGNVLTFVNEKEYFETLGFLCKEECCVRVYVENNDKAGAWAPQGRMQLRSEDASLLPRALKEAFLSSADNRISETGYIKNLKEKHFFTREEDPTGNGYTKYLFKKSLTEVQNTVPAEYMEDFTRGYEWDTGLIARIKKLKDFEVNLDEETEHILGNGHMEGRVKEYYSKKYERNAGNRAAAIRIHGTRCAICGFDFEETYGKLGKGFIEVHHIKPLSEINEEVVVNPETDLICVCSNCHRMLHRFKDYIIEADELKKMIKRTV